MTVIVKDIDKPEDCNRCPRYLQSRKTTSCYPLVGDCPIKSVEGLIEQIEKVGGDEEKSVYKNLNPSYVQGLKDAIKYIKEYCGLEDSNG